MDFAKCSDHHRTTLGHFLNKGRWDDSRLSSSIRKTVIETIYSLSQRTGKPIFCIIDDTISSKTKPSSQALNPMEGASFHMSHLEGKQTYGHQAVAVMLSCGETVLNYAILMYDKTTSKIALVCDIAKELPQPPNAGYLLCDSWYSCQKVMDSFIQRGFYTIGALKTNRILYPCGIRTKLCQFALHLQKTDANVHLVTVGKRSFYVARYEGQLNGIEDAVVLLSYPKEQFGQQKSLRAFICTQVELATEEILQFYTQRWPIEVFFRSTKGKLALNHYQIRSTQGIQRFWLLMSLAHLLCCIGTGTTLPFSQGYSIWQSTLTAERIRFIYDCGREHMPFSKLLESVA